MRPFVGSATEWNAIIAGLPAAHLLQTWEWAEVKAAYGWQPMPYVWVPAAPTQSVTPKVAAMVLKRRIMRRTLAAHLCILYSPKGPLLDWDDATLRAQVLEDLEAMAEKERAIFLKLDPDVVLGRGVPDVFAAGTENLGEQVAAQLRQRRWIFSNEQVQFRNTIMIDLTRSEDALLHAMKQKTRYNIRLAEKRGVSVRTGTADDLPALYRMYATTSERDGFAIRNEGYYRKVWETFMRPRASREEPRAEPLIAEVKGQAVAAIFVFYFAKRAYYIYGMSGQAHRDKMPNHLLQWEAVKHAKRLGCTHYDLWGAPDIFDESDPMWSVFRFKGGLGGEVVRTLGAWDFPANSFWYPIFTRLLPRILEIMRARGRQRVRQDLAAT
jgi:lipid II:glycine glycyltransferase (peptidoglycan interpeptide bridge formation enzyme)